MTPGTKILLVIVGAVVVGGALAVAGGSSSAATPGGNTPKRPLGGKFMAPDTKPGAGIPGAGPGADENWGYIPRGLIPHFKNIEQASGLAGIGRFAAVLAWARYRAWQPPLNDGDAYEFGVANPDLGLNSQSILPAAIKSSFQALERATLKKGDGPGVYGGYGVFQDPRPRPKFYKKWGEIGEVGLYSWLGGRAAFAGYADNQFMPFWDLHAEVLKKIASQLFVLAYEVRQLLLRPDLEIFRLSGTPTDPALLWPNIAQCLDDEEGYLMGSKDVYSHFVTRASECGIQLPDLQVPDPKKWPGGPQVYQAIGGPRA